MPDPDLEIRGGGGGGPPGPLFVLKIKGDRAPPPRITSLDPPLYHDIRFTVVGIDPGLVVHGVGQVSMQIRGTSKTWRA